MMFIYKDMHTYANIIMHTYSCLKQWQKSAVGALYLLSR